MDINTGTVQMILSILTLCVVLHVSYKDHWRVSYWKLRLAPTKKLKIKVIRQITARQSFYVNGLLDRKGLWYPKYSKIWAEAEDIIKREAEKIVRHGRHYDPPPLN